MTIPQHDENLHQFATERQWQILEAIWANDGNQSAAARQLGISESRVRKIKQTVAERAARQGYAPEHNHMQLVPPGFHLRGSSTLYRRGEQEPLLQWVKTSANHEAQERIARETVAALADDLPREQPKKPPKHQLSDLLAAYPVGDHHLGMYAWAEEAGEDYDLTIAERLLGGAVNHLTTTLPAAEKALVVLLGDFFHYDSRIPETPENRNNLDSDSRHQKMIRIGVRLVRHVLRRTLQRHTHVRVIIEKGNHDPFSSAFLAECLAILYEEEPRVEVDTSPSLFHYYEFGKCLVGVHHGHSVKKLDKLPLIMAADNPEAWGRTRHRYWWTGHIHKDTVQDVAGVRVESFRVLPPTDAWASGMGYRTAREMKGLVLHREHGEVARYAVNPLMLEER